MEFFASGMLVIANGSNLYLLPKDKRLRIAESLCSLESGSLWKQVDLGNAVGPPFKAQEGVLRSACCPWEESGNRGKRTEECGSRELESPHTTDHDDEIIKGQNMAVDKKEVKKCGGRNINTTFDAGEELMKKKKKKNEKENLMERQMAEVNKMQERKKALKERKLSLAEEMVKFADIVRGVVNRAADAEGDRIESCLHCGKMDFAMGFCSRCREVRYCDRECYNKDKKHRKTCVGVSPSGFDAALAKCIDQAEAVVIPNLT